MVVGFRLAHFDWIRLVLQANPARTGYAAVQGQQSRGGDVSLEQRDRRSASRDSGMQSAYELQSEDLIDPCCQLKCVAETPPSLNGINPARGIRI